MITCIICGDRVERHRGGRGRRCGTCASYRYQRGVDRSECLVMKLTERDIERKLMRRRT